jgi:hypothetical protein
MKSVQLFLLLVSTGMTALAQNEINEKLIPYQSKLGKWGYLDADSDKIVIPAKYDFVNLFENGVAQVGNNNQNSENRFDQGFEGFIRENGEEIFPVNFTGIYEVKNRRDSILQDLRMVTFANKSTGIISLSGKWIVEAGKYQNFEFYSTTQYLADNIDFYDGNKKYSAPKNCKIVSVDFANRFFEIIKEDEEPNQGICTWEGEIIIQPKYIDIQLVNKSKIFVASTISGGTIGKNFEKKDIDNSIFDENGLLITTFKSKQIPFLRDDYGEFEYKSKLNYFDLKTGKIVGEAIANHSFTGTVFNDAKTNLYGFKNPSGQIIISPIYQSLLQSENNIDYFFALKQILGKYYMGLLDGTGTIVIPFEYEQIQYNSATMLVAQKNGKYGAIDFSNKVLISFLYKYHFYFDHGLTNVHTDLGEGVIDNYGSVIIPTEYQTVFRYEVEDKVLMDDKGFNYNNSTYFAAEKDNKWGLLNVKGKLIIPFQYGYIRKANDELNFKKGWIITEDLKRNKNGLINIYTNVNIPPNYETIKIFDHFLIVSKRIESNYTYQLLDLKGKAISETIYDKMEFVNGYFIVSNNKLSGVMNENGEIVVPLKYNSIWSETPNLVRVFDEESYYYININSAKEYKVKE